MNARTLIGVACFVAGVVVALPWSLLCVVGMVLVSCRDKHTSTGTYQTADTVYLN